MCGFHSQSYSGGATQLCGWSMANHMALLGGFDNKKKTLQVLFFYLKEYNIAFLCGSHNHHVDPPEALIKSKR